MRKWGEKDWRKKTPNISGERERSSVKMYQLWIALKKYNQLVGEGILGSNHNQIIVESRTLEIQMRKLKGFLLKSD